MRRRNEFSTTTKTDSTLKSLLIKMFLILVIILVLVWLIPKFFLYKNTKKHEAIKEEKTEVVVIKEETVNSLENAGIKYFNEGNTPKNVGEKKKVTLKELQDSRLIGTLKVGNTTCDIKNSYVELTKNNDYYVVMSNLTCSTASKNKLTHVSNYSYCNNSYLCVADLQKEKEIAEKNKNVQVPSTGVNDNEEKELTEFGQWKNYRETSCDRQEIKCDINNTNCLREVRIEKVKELVYGANQIYKDVCYSSERTREYK